jgi:hypothetical protein
MSVCAEDVVPVLRSFQDNLFPLERMHAQFSDNHEAPARGSSGGEAGNGGGLSHVGFAQALHVLIELTGKSAVCILLVLLGNFYFCLPARALTPSSLTLFALLPGGRLKCLPQRRRHTPQ